MQTVLIWVKYGKIKHYSINQFIAYVTHFPIIMSNVCIFSHDQVTHAICLILP